MILFRKAADINNYLQLCRSKNKRIGFVPTMGALHQGHISLIDASKHNCEITVCSIFVNPTQFNDASDFEKYPTTLEKDIDALENAGCDVLFLPSVAEMYPDGTQNLKNYDLGYLETVLEGKYRPGHFQGVCQVVHRLLNIIICDQLYLGQKDYQQCMVIKKMVETEHINTSINICPTLREKGGLAMSSRNMRLSGKEKEKALAIFETLTYLKEHIKPGSLLHLKTTATSKLTNAGFKVDYVEIADASNLDIVSQWDGKQKLVAVAAAFLGEVRLIDNLLL